MRAIVLPLASLALACGGGGGPEPATCPLPVADPAPSFSKVILPRILQASCGAAASTCHAAPSADGPRGHVTYATGPGGSPSDVHASLVNAAPWNAPPGWVLVRPGDAPGSWLIEKVTKDQPGGSGFGARMPASGANLCGATVETLRAWIDRGALDD